MAEETSIFPYYTLTHGLSSPDGHLKPEASDTYTEGLGSWAHYF